MWVWVLPVLLLTFRVLLYATDESNTSKGGTLLLPTASTAGMNVETS